MRSTRKYYLKEDGETTQDAVRAHGQYFFKSVGEAVIAAETEISPGAFYSVINDEGEEVYFNVNRGLE